MRKLADKLRRPRYLAAAYAVMLLVIFILPGYSAPGYSILAHSTSELGAQHTPNAWIMNAVFFFLGAACLLEAWLHIDYWFQKICLSVFGFSLILTAFFQHAPIASDMAFSVGEDQIHSLLASVVGFSFTIFAFSMAFVYSKPVLRGLALGLALTAVGLSALMFSVPGYTGLLQRAMFISAFSWLIFVVEQARHSGSNYV